MLQSMSLEDGDTLTYRIGADVHGLPVVRLQPSDGPSWVLTPQDLGRLRAVLDAAEADLRRAVDKVLAVPHEPKSSPVAA
jgi:hypothetical protein